MNETHTSVRTPFAQAIEFGDSSGMQPTFPIATTARIPGIDAERAWRDLSAASKPRHPARLHAACAGESVAKPVLTLPLSADRKSLRSKSPKNGNFCGRGRRLSE